VHNDPYLYSGICTITFNSCDKRQELQCLLRHLSRVGSDYDFSILPQETFCYARALAKLGKLNQRLLSWLLLFAILHIRPEQLDSNGFEF